MLFPLPFEDRALRTLGVQQHLRPEVELEERAHATELALGLLHEILVEELQVAVGAQPGSLRAADSDALRPELREGRYPGGSPGHLPDGERDVAAVTDQVDEPRLGEHRGELRDPHDEPRRLVAVARLALLLGVETERAADRLRPIDRLDAVEAFADDPLVELPVPETNVRLQVGAEPIEVEPTIRDGTRLPVTHRDREVRLRRDREVGMLL